MDRSRCPGRCGAGRREFGHAGEVGVPTSTTRRGGVPTADELLALGRQAGLAAVGFASAEVLQPARDVLHLRKRAGLAGDMQFTYRNPDRSTDPTGILPSARTLIAGAWGYRRWEAPEPPPGPTRARVARYAWHDHYRDLEVALGAMARPLREAGQRAVVVADSNGLVDRNVAWSAGLGWYGKNSNLLIPGAGSWFVLGAVVTDAEIPTARSPQQDGCGPCTRCLDDCPTGAIIGPGVGDATRCLAWLVQADGAIPRRWREAIGDRIYGCDDCQDVCPPNRDQRDRGPVGEWEPDPVAEIDQASVDLDWLLTADDAEIIERHGRWYIARRDPDNIRRTALVVLGNVAVPGRPGVRRLLRRYLGHPQPVLRSHAVWAARRLGLGSLATAAAGDPEPMVRAELRGEVAARFTPEQWDEANGLWPRPTTGRAPGGS